jgi:hypothetical protein
MLPDRAPTLDGVWNGGCDGHFTASTEEGPGRIKPREWDEAVRTLGVQRAVSKSNETQEKILVEKVEEFAEELKGKTMTREQVKTMINTLLIPRIEYPLRDTPQTNSGGALVEKLEVKIRTVLKNAMGLVTGINTSYLYSDLGLGLASLRTRLDGDMFERLQRSLLEPTARKYWKEKMTTHEEREATHRQIVEDESAEELEMRMKRADEERGLVDEFRRRAKIAGLAHDVTHVMRMEYEK